MATITIYLKYQKADLFYSADNVKFRRLEEDSIIGVDAGDTVYFKVSDDSIEKINSIKVNEDKGGRKNRKEIWDQIPKAVDKTKKIYMGTIKRGLDNVPKYNGYTIKYKTADGDKEKDPEFEQPKDGDGE